MILGMLEIPILLNWTETSFPAATLLKAAIRLPCSALLRCYRRQTIIDPSLTNLFNLLLELEFSQRDWKLAKVTPICKNDKKSIPGNYRPISVLTAVTKLREKTIFSNLTVISQNMVYFLTLNQASDPYIPF